MPEPSFLIAGLGSAGRRHLKNLVSLGIENITLLRTGLGTMADEELQAFSRTNDIYEALGNKPDAVIIANPTAFHLAVALPAAAAGCNLFIEKPLSHSLEDIPQLSKNVEDRNLIVMTGFQFRFNPALRCIKKWTEEGKAGRIVSAHASYAECLPDWHPWEDYRSGYSARSDLGGGPVLTLCHPFDYLRWFFGEVESVSAVTRRLSSLEIDTEDTAQIILRFRSGTIGSVYLDYVRKPPKHALEIIGEEGIIAWNSSDNKAQLIPGDVNKTLVFKPSDGFGRNFMFREEMLHFLECLREGKQPLCSLEEGIRALQIAQAAKRSSQERKEIDV